MNINILRQAFQKLSSDTQTYIQTDRTEIIYHATLQVVSNNYMLKSSDALQYLTHESTEAVESARNSGARVDLNEHVLLCVNIDLQQSGTVQWTVH